MWLKTFESPCMVFACYCVLGLGITSIFAQDDMKETLKVSAEESTTSDASGQTVSGSKTAKSDSAESESVKPENAEKDAPASGLDGIPTNTSTSPINAKTKKENATSIGFMPDYKVPEWFPADYQTGIIAGKDADLIPLVQTGYEDPLREDAREAVREAVAEYIDLKVGKGASDYVRFSIEDLDEMGVLENQAYVTGTDKITGDEAPSQRYYAMLKMNSNFRAKAKQIWIEKRQSSRLMQIGLVSGGLLLVIGFLFGTLRLNTATSGFYQGRLQFLGGVVILGIIAAAAYFGLQLDWI